MQSFSRRFILGTAPVRLVAVGVVALAALDSLRTTSTASAAGAAITPSGTLNGSDIINGTLRGTLSLSDPTFAPGRTAVHYRALSLINPNPHRGKYTFSLTTNGFQGALYLYQAPFVPKSSPPPNLWARRTTGKPVKLSTVLSSTYQSSFVLLVASTTPGGVGSFSLSITGPVALRFPPPPAPPKN